MDEDLFAEDDSSAGSRREEPPVDEDLFAEMSDDSSAGSRRDPDGSSDDSSTRSRRGWDGSSVSHPPLERVDSLVGTPPPRDDECYPGMSLFEARSIPHGSTIITHLKYGFGIGRLYHQMPDASQPQDTEFYVVCNALDKSI